MFSKAKKMLWIILIFAGVFRKVRKKTFQMKKDSKIRGDKKFRLPAKGGICKESVASSPGM
jgi:hypothetical protein